MTHATPDEYLPPVTAHAVLRYMTRILGLSIAGAVKQVGRNATNWETAQAACALHGLDFAALQRTICPPHVARLITPGLKNIRHAGMRLTLDGGQVVTLIEGHRRGTKSCKKGTGRRERGRMDRRFRT